MNRSQMKTKENNRVKGKRFPGNANNAQQRSSSSTFGSGCSLRRCLFFYLARSSRRWYYQPPCSPYSRTSEASDAMLSCKAVTQEKQVKSMLNANNMYLKTHPHTTHPQRGCALLKKWHLEAKERACKEKKKGAVRWTTATREAARVVMAVKIDAHQKEKKREGGGRKTKSGC